MAKSIKVIQVPMEEQLLKQIDATAGIVAESRSAFAKLPTALEKPASRGARTVVC
jgi:hypothetical protein